MIARIETAEDLGLLAKEGERNGVLWSHRNPSQSKPRKAPRTSAPPVNTTGRPRKEQT